MTLSDDIKWVKGHLITLALAGALVFGAVYGVLYIQDKDRKEALAQQTLITNQLIESNKQTQAASQVQMQTLADEMKQLQANYALLMDAYTKRQPIEAKIPAHNATLSTTEVATQLGGTAQDNNIILPLIPAQHALDALQLVPLLQQDKKDLVNANASLSTQVTNAQSAFNVERTSHASDNTANAAIIKQGADALSSCKADARKGKMKWFFIGAVAGFIGRGFSGL